MAMRTFLEYEGLLELLPNCTMVVAMRYCVEEIASQSVYPFRTICPESCGCTNPFSGFFDLKSCPWLCEETRRNELVYFTAGIEDNCVDAPAAGLARAQQWRRFWEEFDDFYFETLAVPKGMGLDLAMELGCAVVSDSNLSYAASVCEDQTYGDQLQGSIFAFCPRTCGVCADDATNVIMDRTNGTRPPPPVDNFRQLSAPHS